MLEAVTRTSFDHQPEAQHPKSSAIHKPPADYPIFWSGAEMNRKARLAGSVENDPKATLAGRTDLVLERLPAY
jgi:hypothetical protein